MKLLKPSWVTHDGHPIFSVDIHPDGTRFATGGQGADAGRIVIWNMAPVMTEDDEKNENIPKMLSQMDNHLACVNCVRWSGNGKYLASGGDDKVLMIWQQGRYGGGPTTFGSSGKLMSMEQWRCISTLRGHSGDVLDLAWSPHDVWLASCSVDNTVVIWNTSKWQEIVAVLKGHTGLVKGVSWDPVGKYVASQSDDKNLRVWRTHDWLEETVVSEPFEECGGTTHILRLSWSPDGQYLVSAHAMNNSGPTAQIIEREGWKTNKDFVGHRKAITCVKFNPNILSKLNKETGKVHHFCCCAIGSRDRSLSVWLTSLKRPLVVIHSLFSNSVLDVSWSRIGHQLLVCSWDGTVAYVEFSEEEIGKPISEDEKNQLHQRLYGKSLAMTNQLTTSSATVIENPELLKMREEQTFKTEKPKTEVIPNGVMTSQLVDSNSGSKHQDQQSNISRSGYARGPTDKQIETRMPDGRRRITPLYIPPDMGEVAPSYTSGAMPTFSSSKETKSRIVIEKRDETSNCQPNSISPRMQVSLGSVPPKQPSLNIASTNDIQPSPSAAMDRVLTTVSVESDKQKEVQPLPLVDSTPIRVPTKRLAETNSGPGRPPEKRRPGRPPLHPNVQAPTMEKDCRTERQSPPGGGLHLPVLKAEKTLTAQIGSGKVDQTYTLELENNISIGAGLVIHKLKCLSQGGPVWEAVLASRGAGIAGSRHAACVVCEDSTLSLFSAGGQRLLPPVVLSSPATRLTCSDQYVMVLTSRGCVSVWNIQELKTLVKNESLLPIMQAPAGTDLSIRSTGLTEHGAPVVSLSTKKSYIFNFDVGAWLLISSAEDAVYQCSDHQSCLPPNIKFQETLLPLASLQGELNRSPRVARNIFNSNPATRQAATLSHLDSQLAAALSMHSAKDYKFWFLTLVRYLTQEGLEPRLRDLCSELLGPVVQTTKQSSWRSYIMGLSKRELLREILPVMGSNLKLQRLVTEFKEQLDAILT